MHIILQFILISLVFISPVLGMQLEENDNKSYKQAIISFKDMPISKQVKKCFELNPEQSLTWLKEKINDITWVNSPEFLFAVLKLFKNIRKMYQPLDYEKIAYSIMTKNKKVINARDKSNNTPLMIAAKLGLYYVIIELLQRGADINAQNKFGDTALMIALKNDHPELAEVFFEQKAFDLPNFENQTCRHIISAKIVQFSPIKTRDSEYLLYTYIAAQKMPFSTGSNITSLKEIPLMQAINSADVTTIQNLLESSATPNVEDLYGRTPLFIVASNDNERALLIAKLLIKHGAKINASERQSGNAPLLNSVISRAQAMTKLLINLGADVNQSNFYGTTALMIAVQINNLEIVKELLKAPKLNLEATNILKQTALDLAKQNQGTRWEIIKLLEIN